MPQMMPIAWMQMFVLINFTLLLIMAKTHFMKTGETSTHTKNKTPKNNMSWSW